MEGKRKVVAYKGILKVTEESAEKRKGEQEGK